MNPADRILNLPKMIVGIQNPTVFNQVEVQSWRDWKIDDDGQHLSTVMMVGSWKGYDVMYDAIKWRI